MQKEGTILGVQYLRGIAALAVVLCHFGQGIAEYPFLQSFFKFCANGVHVFFLISGFIIIYSLSKVNYKATQFFTFLAKRSIRIDPAYFATIALTLLLLKVQSLLPAFNIPWRPIVLPQLAAHLFYLVPFTHYQFYNHIFWTLCIEFQFYCLIGLLYFLWDNVIYRKMFLVAFAAAWFIPISNAYYIVFTYAPIFALGISLIDLYRSPRWQNGILPVLFLALIAYTTGLGIAVLLLVSSALILGLKVKLTPLFFLGQISYSLYLTHALVNAALFGLFNKLHIDQYHPPLFWLVIKVLIAIAVAWCFYLLIEKPSIQLSKRVFYKRQTKQADTPALKQNRSPS